MICISKLFKYLKKFKKFRAAHLYYWQTEGVSVRHRIQDAPKVAGNPEAEPGIPTNKSFCSRDIDCLCGAGSRKESNEEEEETEAEAGVVHKHAGDREIHFGYNKFHKWLLVLALLFNFRQANYNGKVHCKFLKNKYLQSAQNLKH